VNVLFDLGVMHSFVSFACSEKLMLLMCDLKCELVVSTLVSGQVSTSSVCVWCSIDVVGHKFKGNLLCLPLEGLDVILRMDWLTVNDVLMDCEK